MTLMTAHKILISTALVFSLFLFLREVLEYTATGGSEALLLGIGSGIGSVALGVYLRWLLRQGVK